VRASVDSVMRNHFSAFERGDLAAWSGIFAPDVFFTAANPAQVFASRDSAREGMQREFGPAMQAGLKLAIRPLSDQIWVAGDGRTAAAAYDLDYTVRYESQLFPYRLRSSYLLERDSSGWRVLAAQYSRPVSYDSLFLSLVTR
jgi:ketosteroid isomerase-like protein